MTQAPTKPDPTGIRSAPAGQDGSVVWSARSTAQLSDAVRYLAGYLGIQPPGQGGDGGAGEEIPPGTVTVGPELRVVAGPGEQNALVLDAPASQSSVIHLKRGGEFLYEVLATSDGEAPALQINRFDATGERVSPPAIEVRYDGTVLIDGTPVVATADLEPRVAALEAAVTATNTEVDSVSDDLTALEDRVTALETPAAP